mmetsp:Transcript_79648/g.213344  ORF Transcript_79648/g.213344 Transcript_79648/m.213344 type:complete len:116 (-) Transcript_79648:31-378(-)
MTPIQELASPRGSELFPVFGPFLLALTRAAESSLLHIPSASNPIITNISTAGKKRLNSPNAPRFLRRREVEFVTSYSMEMLGLSRIDNIVEKTCLFLSFPPVDISSMNGNKIPLE